MFRSHAEMRMDVLDQCHDGQGALQCFTALTRGDSEMGIQFMHDDVIEPGASIGEHLHQTEEEIYFVVSGHGAMLLDGQRIPIGPGDVSLVRTGHTHGIVNSTESEMRLIVVCVRNPKGEIPSPPSPLPQGEG